LPCSHAASSRTLVQRSPELCRGTTLEAPPRAVRAKQVLVAAIPAEGIGVAGEGGRGVLVGVYGCPVGGKSGRRFFGLRRAGVVAAEGDDAGPEPCVAVLHQYERAAASLRDSCRQVPICSVQDQSGGDDRRDHAWRRRLRLLRGQDQAGLRHVVRGGERSGLPRQNRHDSQQRHRPARLLRR
jgi:hypothetical protein